MRVQLPENFVGVKRYPGYFYNTEDKQLYSLKSGILKPLKLQKPYYRMNIGYHYNISINGWRKNIPVSFLETMGEKDITYKINTL